MIKVYILDSNIEEISHKGVLQITDEEFKLLGKECTIEQFEHELNHCINVYNQSRDHVRFIDIPEEKTSLNTLLGYFKKGFTVYFVENPAIAEGKGYLHLNPQNMPKP